MVIFDYCNTIIDEEHPSKVLDIALNYLKSQSIFSDDLSVELGKSNLEPKIIVRAWEKLAKDGYAYTEKTQHSEHNQSIRYFITFDGLQVLSDSPFPYKGKPYEWARKKIHLKRLWTITSVLAIVINAIIVLVFTYLTYLRG